MVNIKYKWCSGKEKIKAIAKKSVQVMSSCQKTVPDADKRSQCPLEAVHSVLLLASCVIY